ncbi:glucosaminidase domain-containing protein [Granulosicoccaceae sp. 1_MG-2023]|nr:glucosaminidase domain-containing protein [Granulosicoccaceae sp. 1_MG-2023]
MKNTTRLIAALLLVLPALPSYANEGKAEGHVSIQTRANYSVSTVPENMTVEEKKARFAQLLLPPLKKVHAELEGTYEIVRGKISRGDRKGLDKLKKYYEVESDEALLAALKPHPVSIALAQAAMESAWATSRFIREANNAFGIWSFKSDEPRIAAGKTRGSKTIWLKRYDSLEESVRDFYKLIARSPAFREFRQLRLQTDDPHQLVTKLHRYSEKGSDYGRSLSAIIRQNDFTAFDAG